MRRDIVSAGLAVVVLTLLLGLAYPLAVTGVAQVVFPGQANGGQVKVVGKVVGSRRIGQSFADPVVGRDGKAQLDANGNALTTPDPGYFQSRPSASDYDGAASGGSNLGPNSDALIEAVTERRAQVARFNGVPC